MPGVVEMTRAAFVLLALVLVAPVRGAVGSPTAPPRVVSVTLTDTTLKTTPARVPAGAVLFRVANRSRYARRFAVAGRRTSTIARGRSATLSVELRKSGPHALVSRGERRVVPLSGVLTVFVPCLHPTVSTVGVRMDHDRSGITFSQPTIPCGTVTFVVANVGTAPDSLQVGSDSAGGTTPVLAPGQTARLTVRFAEKGLAYYMSGSYPPGETELGGSEADGGRIRIV